MDLLKWYDFNENLALCLKEYFIEKRFTDVTLVSDDKIAFKARKFVLGASSPF